MSNPNGSPGFDIEERDSLGRIAPVHGYSVNPKTRQLYAIWKTMRHRCASRGNPKFPDYGGRGIRVCRRWRESFEAFVQDMGPRPKGLTLGRKDNEGNYEPSNCEWQTPLTQSNNRRINRFLIVNGVKRTVSEWSRELGVKADILYYRIRCGWTASRIVNYALKTKTR